MLFYCDQIINDMGRMTCLNFSRSYQKVSRQLPSSRVNAESGQFRLTL